MEQILPTKIEKCPHCWAYFTKGFDHQCPSFLVALVKLHEQKKNTIEPGPLEEPCALRSVNGLKVGFPEQTTGSDTTKQHPTNSKESQRKPTVQGLNEVVIFSEARMRPIPIGIGAQEGTC